jgi:hypothetical protein
MDKPPRAQLKRCRNGHDLTLPDACYVYEVKGHVQRQCKECAGALQHLSPEERKVRSLAHAKRQAEKRDANRKYAYTPDAKDADVKRCRKERERVLKLRLKYGEEWYVVVAKEAA